MRTGDTQSVPTGVADVSVFISFGGNPLVGSTFTDRIVSVRTDEGVFGSSITVVMDNSDGGLDSISYVGELLVLSLIYTGGTYSVFPTYRVEKQARSSDPGKLQIIVTAFDKVAHLALYKGSVGGSLWNHPSQSSAALDSMVLPSGEALPAALKTAILAQYDKTPLQITGCSSCNNR